MPDLNVKISELRTRITLQQPTVTTDAGAAQKTTYANVTNDPVVWARWVNAHGQEVVGSEALKTEQRAVVVLRYRADIQTTWRVLKDDQPWQILSIDHVQDRHHWTELVVERAKGTI